VLVEAGLTPGQAVQVMSFNGARILHEDTRYGTVTPGKQADLVVIRGNPEQRSADIYNVVTVFKEGRGFDSTKMLTAIRGMVGVR
jgi:imidazolonepropionase-like amidohydrolase